MEGNVFKKMAKYFKGTQTAGNKFLNPAVNTLAPVIGMALGAKGKSPQVGQATTNILESISDTKDSIQHHNLDSQQIDHANFIYH